MELSNASLVVVLCVFIHMMGIGSDNYYYHNQTHSQSVIFLVTQGLAYLLYPLLGWMADVWFTRYKFVRLSLVLMIPSCCAIVVVVIANLLTNDHYPVMYLIAGVALIVCLVALGMFEATAIQFGMDQMLEASSDELSTFIQWYYWGSNLARLGYYCIMTGFAVYFSNCNMKEEHFFDNYIHYVLVMGSALALILSIEQIVFSVGGLSLLAYSRKNLVTDQIRSSPWRLVHDVLLYAWKHTCPERRSAFTYWEDDIPPRIDLGKNKYGGPFTTEEVENTKTFLRILLLLLPLLSSQLLGCGYSVLNQLAKHDCPPYWMTVIADPMFVSVLVVVIGMPVYQCVLLPRIRKYLPNMLKRMGLGLMLCLAKEVSELIIKVTVPVGCVSEDRSPQSCFFLTSDIHVNDSCERFVDLYSNFTCTSITSNHFTWLIIPVVLHGLSLLLVFMTTLKFICAQAPLQMKGVLISLWYSSQAVSFLIVGVPEVFIDNSNAWSIFQSGKICLIFVSFVAYVCVSKRYRYRHRDEVVNVQYLVEDVYEREIALAKEYESQSLSTVYTCTCTYGTSNP